MSAFLPQFQHDVFVSYARVDNQPLLPGDEGSCWGLALKSALQKKHRAPECAVFVGPPCDKAPLRCRPPRFHVIDHHDQARLESFITAVTARRSTG